MGSALDKRMVAYSAAVAAAGLATAETAHGAIIANTTPQVVATGNAANIDFNGDAVTDLSITNQTNAKNGNKRYYVNGQGTGQYATSPYPTDTAQSVRPTAFTNGQLIGPALTFGLDSGGLSNTLAGNNNATTDGTSVTGLFAQDGTTVNYVGVSFLNGAQTDYGWVGVILDPSGNSSPNFTVTGYAYDDSGAAIAAGATTTPTGPTVPEPTSMAALAFGAAAMMRRKRKAVA